MYLLSLSENAHIQAKLHQELSQINSSSPDDLPYLEAVIKEGLRCFPPIPMSAPRHVPAGGRTINGYFIPAGTIVSCQSWSVHRLNEDVYPDGDKFQPDRWLGENINVDMDRLFFAFGGGGRGCIGRQSVFFQFTTVPLRVILTIISLAMAEMRTLLKTVYSKFRTRVADDMYGSMEMSDQIISSRPLGQTCKLIFDPR